MEYANTSDENGKPSISVVIPAYNEESSISDVIRRIRAQNEDWEILVIDDGSSDDTATNAENAGARVVRHLINRGNGAAVKTALRTAQSDYVVVIDADGQHPPEDISRLLEQLKTNDLVVGARTSASDSEFTRDVGNFIFRKIASLLMGQEIPDLTSGFRAFNRRKVSEFIHLYPNGFSFPSTSTLCLIASGQNVAFVPILAAQRPAHSKSKIRVVRDGFRFVWLILRITIVFSPMRLFGSLTVIPTIAGIVWSVIRTVFYRRRSSTGTILILSGVTIGLFGLIVDQLSTLRRQIYSISNELRELSKRKI